MDYEEFISFQKTLEGLNDMEFIQARRFITQLLKFIMKQIQPERTNEETPKGKRCSELDGDIKTESEMILPSKDE